jgi:hypothetical protein
MFGCNTYSYMRARSAAQCLVDLSELGFREFELMAHPGHLWPAELSDAQRRSLCRLIEERGLRLVTVNMPNVDINVAGASAEMRAYSLGLLTEIVPPALAAAGHTGRPMLEIISRDPDRDIMASADKLARLGFAA